jgi:hypothetical protein
MNDLHISEGGKMSILPTMERIDEEDPHALFMHSVMNSHADSSIDEDCPRNVEYRDSLLE